MVALLATGVLAGCGGDDKPSIDRADPGSVVKGYLNAMADDDTGLACTLLTPQVQRRAIKLIGKPIPGNVKTCKQALDVVAQQNDEGAKKLLREAKLTRVATKGVTATVASSATGTLKLRKGSDGWAISSGIYN